MDIKSQRLIATIIDYSIIAIFLAVCGMINVPEWFWRFQFSVAKIPFSLPSFGFFLVVTLITFKDVIFRNASLGKRLLGLCIVDLNGNYPSVTRLMKRGFFMPTLGYVQFLMSKFSYDYLDKWEARHIGTKVIFSSSRHNKEDNRDINI